LPPTGSLASAGAGRDATEPGKSRDPGAHRGPGAPLQDGQGSLADTRGSLTDQPGEPRRNPAPPTTAWQTVPPREPAQLREPGTPTTVQPGQRAAPGAVIGNRYSLRTAIGHGGMGTVWRATDTVLRRDVAVKEVLLPPGMADSDRDAMYQRTLREARAAAALSHPAVVQVYDVVTEAGRPWIIMELLQARSLAEMIVEDGPFAPRAVAKIGIALLGALEVAHAAGVLHRDVKPANVLICGDGRCVLTDFGVARMPTDSELTTPGMVLGSPHFISPERAIGAKFGPPSDLFSLGVTLYTAVEGRPPFDRRDPFETMRAVVEEPPAPAVRAGALAGVLYGLLEKDPARRWTVETARAVLRDLLVGPLASNAPAHVTDPYAVVRPQPYTPPKPPPNQPTGQLGGRAMLAPGESVTGALRRMQDGREPDQHDAGTGRFSAPPAQDGPYGSDWMQSGVPQPAPARPGLSSQARQLVTRAKGMPRWALGAVAAGVVLVLVLAVGGLAGWFSGSGDPNAGASAAASAPASNGPSFAVLAYTDAHGITVNVPEGWTKAPASAFTDFVDPSDSGRKIRINGSESAKNVTSFFTSAENRLKTVSSSCTPPYARVDLRTITLDGKQGAELEYTCGSGTTMRHALWGAVVISGHAYHFFVTVPEAKFATSKVIYQEMVRSFKVAPQ